LWHGATPEKRTRPPKASPRPRSVPFAPWRPQGPSRIALASTKILPTPRRAP
jgi:hypothetical protein